jgi:S1-C subfamily serine protease
MAGMRRGDVLMAIDGHYLTTVKQLIALLHTYAPGSRVAIRYRRGVSLIDTEITLTAGQ